MRNRRRLVLVGMFAFTLAGCESGDGTQDGNDPGDNGVTDDAGHGDDTAPTCEDGVCDNGEGCSSCVNDCACAEQYTACRDDACVDWDSINPLLEKIPGHWLRVEPLEYPAEADITVDPTDNDCALCIASHISSDPNPNEPGDACVGVFLGVGCFVLHGSSIRITHPDTANHAEGQVLNEGTRMEYIYTLEGLEYTNAWERQ